MKTEIHSILHPILLLKTFQWKNNICKQNKYVDTNQILITTKKKL